MLVMEHVEPLEAFHDHSMIMRKGSMFHGSWQGRHNLFAQWQAYHGFDRRVDILKLFVKFSMNKFQNLCQF